MEKPKFFKTGDYIHLALAVLGTGLCIWGGIATSILVAKIICFVVAALSSASFAVLAIAFRLPQWKAYHTFMDVEGAFRMRWKAGNKSKFLLTPDVLKNWSYELVQKIYNHPTWGLVPRSEIISALNGTCLEFVDAQYIEYNGDKFSGLTWADKKMIKIATFKKGTSVPDGNRMESLFSHEVGHVYVFCALGVADQTRSHEIIKELGL